MDEDEMTPEELELEFLLILLESWTITELIILESYAQMEEAEAEHR